jgi:hypothetical protein
MSQGKAPYDRVLVQSNEEGVFTLQVDSKECGDVSLQLSPAVSLALSEIVINALSLQIELDKIPREVSETFPIEMALNVLKGMAFFQALDPSVTQAQKFNGMFGAAEPQGEN